MRARSRKRMRICRRYINYEREIDRERERYINYERERQTERERDSQSGGMKHQVVVPTS